MLICPPWRMGPSPGCPWGASLGTHWRRSARCGGRFLSPGSLSPPQGSLGAARTRQPPATCMTGSRYCIGLCCSSTGARLPGYSGACRVQSQLAPEGPRGAGESGLQHRGGEGEGGLTPPRSLSCARSPACVMAASSSAPTSNAPPPASASPPGPLEASWTAPGGSPAWKGGPIAGARGPHGQQRQQGALECAGEVGRQGRSGKGEGRAMQGAPNSGKPQ